MSALLAALGIGGGGLLTREALQRLGEIGDTAWTRSGDIATEGADRAGFTGYGVSGPYGGSFNVGADGSSTMNLGADQQALADQLATGAQGMFDMGLNPDSPEYARLDQAMNQSYDMGGMFNERAGLGIADRTESIYNDLRAMMRPEEERQRLAQEERLAAQGRTGIRTAQYGGTPEQLALAKAQEEAKNAAWYQARGQGMGEQAQQAQLGQSYTGMGYQGDQLRQGMQQGYLGMGQGMLTSSYLPQQALMDIINAGNQAYGFEDVARRQGANLWSEGRMGGLDTYLAANLGQANLFGQLGSGLLTGTANVLAGL